MLRAYLDGVLTEAQMMRVTLTEGHVTEATMTPGEQDVLKAVDTALALLQQQVLVIAQGVTMNLSLNLAVYSMWQLGKGQEAKAYKLTLRVNSDGTYVADLLGRINWDKIFAMGRKEWPLFSARPTHPVKKGRPDKKAPR